MASSIHTSWPSSPFSCLYPQGKGAARVFAASGGVRQLEGGGWPHIVSLTPCHPFRPGEQQSCRSWFPAALQDSCLWENTPVSALGDSHTPGYFTLSISPVCCLCFSLLLTSQSALTSCSLACCGGFLMSLPPGIKSSDIFHSSCLPLL